MINIVLLTRLTIEMGVVMNISESPLKLHTEKDNGE